MKQIEWYAFSFMHNFEEAFNKPKKLQGEGAETPEGALRRAVLRALLSKGEEAA